MAVFAYARVSTADQNVAGQFLEIEQAGYQVDADFRFDDVGVSGSVPAADRPGFQSMLGKLRKGETVVVTKLDRLGRDTVDIMQTVRKLSDMGVKVVVLQLGNVDLTSSAGKLILSVLASVAEMERDLIRERTMAGLALARAEGRVGGRPRGTTEAQRQRIKEMSEASKPDAAIAVNWVWVGRLCVPHWARSHQGALGRLRWKAKDREGGLCQLLARRTRYWQNQLIVLSEV